MTTLDFSTATRSERTHYTCRANASPMRGIYYEAGKAKWRAMIRFQGRNIRLGRYRNIEDAARAYDSEARKLFGPFARTNFGRDGVLPKWTPKPKPEGRRMNVQFARDEELQRWVDDERPIEEMPSDVQAMLELYSELNLARAVLSRQPPVDEPVAGVYPSGKKKPWRARVWIDGQGLSLGYFWTAAEAAQAIRDYKRRAA